MTGFGSAQTTYHNHTVKVDCRSVNHRGLDIRVQLPRTWTSLEPAVLKLAKSRLHRGRVEIRVDVAASSNSNDIARFVDPVAFAAGANELRRLAEENGLPPVVAADVLALRDVLTRASEAAVEPNESLIDAVVAPALSALIANREREGARLEETMFELLGEVETGLTVVRRVAPTIADDHRQKLETRVRDALAKFDVGDFSEQRLLQEVVHYADRADVSEEIQRAASHVERLRDLFGETDGPAGKQIDFYLQELIREANTTGSKTTSSEITDAVVAMKSAIEQMREQAANIE